MIQCTAINGYNTFISKLYVKSIKCTKCIYITQFLSKYPSKRVKHECGVHCADTQSALQANGLKYSQAPFGWLDCWMHCTVLLLIKCKRVLDCTAPISSSAGRTNGCWPPAMPSLRPDMSIGFSTKWKHEDDRADEFIEITLWAGILSLKTDKKCHLPPLATPGEWNFISGSFIPIFGFPNLYFWRQCLRLYLNEHRPYLHLLMCTEGLNRTTIIVSVYGGA